MKSKKKPTPAATPAAPPAMVPVATVAGHNVFIPSGRAELRITHAWLEEHSACHDGCEWFNTNFPDGCTYLELRTRLASEAHTQWESWIQAKVGGDSATAGDGGTATAGYRGTATAGDGGTATAGDRGTATAGYRGTATAGDGGTATAGDRGTATAGDRGTATAGELGVISIQYYDAKAKRMKVIIGYVGEGGLLPGVAYKLNEQAQFVPANPA